MNNSNEKQYLFYFKDGIHDIQHMYPNPFYQSQKEIAPNTELIKKQINSQFGVK